MPAFHSQFKAFVPALCICSNSTIRRKQQSFVISSLPVQLLTVTEIYVFSVCFCHQSPTHLGHHKNTKCVFKYIRTMLSCAWYFQAQTQSVYVQSSERAKHPQYFMRLGFKVKRRTYDEILMLKIISATAHGFDLWRIIVTSFWLILNEMSRAIFSWASTLRAFCINLFADETKSCKLPIQHDVIIAE